MNNSCSASNNLNTCLEKNSLLHIEAKKQKLCQTNKFFNFHSVDSLSQVPLARGFSALPSPFFCAGSSTVFEVKLTSLLPVHASKQGKVIGVDVHIYVYMWTKK